MDYPRVSIIILNWNKWQQLIRCLESFYQLTYPNYDVVVVDNASQDGSVEKIKEWAEGRTRIDSKYFQYCPENKPIIYVEHERREIEATQEKEDLPGNKKLIIIKNEENYSYAKGNNIGTRYALKVLDPEYILLIHNDCVVAPNFLNELISAATTELKAGIIGPKILYYSEPTKAWSEGGLINYWTGQGSQTGSKLAKSSSGKDVVSMDWVPTCCALISRQLLDTIGLLDESFFWSGEELDLCLRARKQGFKILFVPKSVVWHDNVMIRGGYKGKQHDYQSYCGVQGRLILLRKHWHGIRLVTATIYFLLNEMRDIYPFLRFSRNKHRLILHLRGILDYSRGRWGQTRP